MTTTPIVFLDTETTGLHADRRVWEVAIIRRDGAGPREIVMQVTDVDLSNAELKGLNIGRFYERHHQYGLFDPAISYVPLDNDDPSPMLTAPITVYVGSEATVARHVEHWTRGAHIVGAVPNFDTECLSAMLRRHGLTPAWHYHLIDIEALAVGFLRGIEYADPNFVDDTANFDILEADLPWKSDDLSRAIGVEPPSEDERHTAMGDARWAMRIYDRITGGAA